MYDKRNFYKANDHKVLHKIKKQWLVISVASLMMVGGAVAVHADASADVTSSQSVTAQVQSKPKVTNKGVTGQAKQLHNQLVKQSAQQTLRLGGRRGRKFNRKHVSKWRIKKTRWRGQKNVRGKQIKRKHAKSRVSYVSKQTYNRYKRQLKRYQFKMRHGSRWSRRNNKRTYYQLKNQVKLMRVKKSRKAVNTWNDSSTTASQEPAVYNDYGKQSDDQSDYSDQPSDNDVQQPSDYSDTQQQSDNGPSQDQINTDLQQFKQQAFNDINNDRANNGQSALNETSEMDNLAAQRAQQLLSNFSHYDSQGNTYYEEDANNLGVDLGDASGENIGGADLGNTSMADDPKSYDNQNGNDMANMVEDSMMNYDQDQGNGHRDNILSGSYTNVGIGTSYDPNSGTFYIAEDFGN